MDPALAKILLSLCIGIGLSASCGFRIFVPMLILSIAASAGQLTLSHHFTWIATTPALIVFASATVVEIIGYYVPWVDNLLDTIATPAAVVAGTIATASVATGMDPVLTWSLAIIAGGGTAAVVQGATGTVRLASSTTTGGCANPLIATVEVIGSTLLSLLALFVPVLAVIIVVILLILAFRAIHRFLLRKRQPAPLPEGSGEV